MVAFCRQNGGIGLAAPQIGLNQAFFVAHFAGRWRAVINPKIVYRSSYEVEGEEGCLSYPGLKVIVPRANRISVIYNDGTTMASANLTGIDSTIFQHEYDHLQGVTINTLMQDGKAKENDRTGSAINL